MDINKYHRTTAHTHPRLLRESTRQQGVKLKLGVKLLPCVRCSTAKGFSAPVKKTTKCRSDTKQGRVFVDLSGKKPVPSMGGKQYGMIFRDDATRMSKEYFVKHKSNAPKALDQYLVDTRDIGRPEIIRSDDAPELKGGRFAETCTKYHINREFNAARTPQLDGVAGRGPTLIEEVAKASAFQAKVSYVSMQLPATETLWAEAHNYSCDVLNCTVTT